LAILSVEKLLLGNYKNERFTLAIKRLDAIKNGHNTISGEFNMLNSKEMMEKIVKMKELKRMGFDAGCVSRL
jgi:hypothetical protein